MYMQRATSGAADNGLYTSIKCMRGAAGIGLSTMIKHLRRATSGTAGNGLSATMKYLRRTTSAAAKNGLSTTNTPPCSAASFEEILRAPHRGTSWGKPVLRFKSTIFANFFRSNFFWKVPFFAIFRQQQSAIFRRFSLREKKFHFSRKKSQKAGSTQLTAQN
jgi:hypothetical protein